MLSGDLAIGLAGLFGWALVEVAADEVGFLDVDEGVLVDVGYGFEDALHIVGADY